jgi:hypothetical protein
MTGTGRPQNSHTVMAGSAARLPLPSLIVVERIRCKRKATRLKDRVLMSSRKAGEYGRVQAKLVTKLKGKTLPLVIEKVKCEMGSGSGELGHPVCHRIVILRKRLFPFRSKFDWAFY